MSIMATSLIHLEKVFIKEKIVSEHKSVNNAVPIVEDESKVSRNESVRALDLPLKVPDIPLQNNDRHLNTQSLNQQKQGEVNNGTRNAIQDTKEKYHKRRNVAVHKTTNEICYSKETDNDERLHFNEGLLTSLGTSSSISSINRSAKESSEMKDIFPNPSATSAENLEEVSVRLFDGDLIHPRVNFIPKPPRKLYPMSNHTWSMKSYSNLSMVERVYLTHPRYRRSPSSLARPVVARHRLCEDGCSTVNIRQIGRRHVWAREQRKIKKQTKSSKDFATQRKNKIC